MKKAILGLLLVASHSFATGLSKSVLIGPKAIGMGGAFVAVADDPTAVFHNPAGITQLEGHDFFVGVDGLITDLSYTPPSASEESATTEVLPVPSFAYVTNIAKPVWLGLGLFFPHGNGGKFSSASSVITNPNEGRIYSMEISPTVAFEPLKGISIGAGFRAVRISSSIKGQFFINPVSSSLDVIDDLDVKGWGYGFSGGLRVSPIKQFAFGASYRSKVSATLNGDVQLASTGTTELEGSLKQNLPSNIQAGFAYYPCDHATLAISYQYEQNSQIEKFEGSVAGQAITPIDQNWSDSSTIHIGGELWNKEKNYGLRLGYAKDLDESIPDTAMTRIVGDIAAHEVSAGLMHKTNQFEFGLTWNARFGERDIPLTLTNPGPGNYSAFVQNISLGVNVNL